MNSKNKGNTFERKVSKIFSERFAIVTGKSQSFRRNIDSGSFFGGSNQKRTETHTTENATFGDINCPVNFKYSLECKHYKQAPSFSNIMKQNCKDWDLWIQQAKQDSNNSNKKMAIIVKYNNVDEIVIVEEAVPEVVNIPYKEYFVVSLADFLALPDINFFE